MTNSLCFWIVMTSSFIVIALFLISLFFLENETNEAGDSPFECGFEAHFLPRVPFSIQFFTITIVFLIFDLEIIILLPLMLLEKVFLNNLMLVLMIILILIIGLAVEWYDMSLEWTV